MFSDASKSIIFWPERSYIPVSVGTKRPPDCILTGSENCSTVHPVSWPMKTREELFSGCSAATESRFSCPWTRERFINRQTERHQMGTFVFIPCEPASHRIKTDKILHTVKIFHERGIINPVHVFLQCEHHKINMQIRIHLSLFLCIGKKVPRQL